MWCVWLSSSQLYAKEECGTSTREAAQLSSLESKAHSSSKKTWLASIERRMHSEGRKQICQRVEAPTHLWSSQLTLRDRQSDLTSRTGPSCLRDVGSPACYGWRVWAHQQGVR